MNVSKFIPVNWFKHEDDEKALAVRQQRDISPVDNFHAEMDRLLDNFFNGFGLRFPTFADSMRRPFFPASSSFGDNMLKPNLDLRADDKEYVVTVELPGVDESNVNIDVRDSMLTISGEKNSESEHKEEGKGLYRMERSYGSFRRTLSLPADADVDGITANSDKGVLRITIPRTEAKKAKSIPITKQMPDK